MCLCDSAMRPCLVAFSSAAASTGYELTKLSLMLDTVSTLTTPLVKGFGFRVRVCALATPATAWGLGRPTPRSGCSPLHLPLRGSTDQNSKKGHGRNAACVIPSLPSHRNDGSCKQPCSYKRGKNNEQVGPSGLETCG